MFPSLIMVSHKFTVIEHYSIKTQEKQKTSTGFSSRKNNEVANVFLYENDHVTYQGISFNKEAQKRDEYVFFYSPLLEMPLKIPINRITSISSNKEMKIREEPTTRDMFSCIHFYQKMVLKIPINRITSIFL